MSELLKANIEDAPYFITLTTVGWVDAVRRFGVYETNLLPGNGKEFTILSAKPWFRSLCICHYVKPFTFDCQAATAAWFIKRIT